MQERRDGSLTVAGTRVSGELYGHGNQAMTCIHVARAHALGGWWSGRSPVLFENMRRSPPLFHQHFKLSLPPEVQ